MKIKAVIGAAYGDEGKGLMTDYFCAQIKAAGRIPAVVRFNGGAQAGHTVVTPGGKRHVFHHFGSGTFVSAETYLAKPFIVNPMVFGTELEVLNELGTGVMLKVHPDCMVTLPYDMIFNQMMEEQRARERGVGRHGSCGMGINATLRRCEGFESERFDQRYTVNSILSMCEEGTIGDYMKEVRDNWYMPLVERWIKDPSIYAKCKRIMEKANAISEFVAAFEDMMEHVTVERNYIHDIAADKDLVFEGAQGLMLDQNADGFPFLTPSNTGVQNVEEILRDMSRRFEFEAVYVTRAYATRHGSGGLPYEEPMPPFVDDETNIPNAFQGTLRYGMLHIDNVKAATLKDNVFVVSIGKNPYCDAATASLAMTCLDQVVGQRKVQWVAKGEVQSSPGPLFVDKMNLYFDYVSYGPTREHVWSHDELFNDQ